MRQRPYTFELLASHERPSEFDRHIVRKLSAMRGQFLNQEAYEDMLARADVVVYEVYELERPGDTGEMRHGLSVVYPGKVGDEYFMTKGHFHAVLETGEIYLCLKGRGLLVMETPEGDSAVEPLKPGRALYVPPRWAHRSVNASLDESLVTFFVYPSHAGHDYRTIEEHGFRKLVIEGNSGPKIIDNPRWLPPERR